MKRLLRLVLLRLLALLARPFARRPAASIGAVLYIKPDHLGDLLLATPALAALRLRYPGARITALVGPWSEMALRRNPDVDALLACPFPGFERRPTTNDQRPTTNDPRGWLSFVVGRSSFVVHPYLTLLRYAALLRAGRYDLAIVGRDDHWWGAALAALAGVPRRVGFAVPECRPFLTNALPWDPRAHVTAQGLALVAAGEASRPGDQEAGLQLAALRVLPKPRFDPAPEDLAWADRWIAEQGLAGARLVVIHPGTGGPAKLWRPERWAAVADALQQDGARVALTGGPDELALAADIAERMRSAPLALAGRTSVGQLAALQRRAALTLGVDSGPLHLAAAQGAPTVHLYGPGDAGRFGPWGDPARQVVVRAELWCSPCGVFGACPRGLAQPECMDRIAVAQVLAVARRLLDRAPC
ncbi:MAG: glycosyltransferase family 9 protein [Kouleothrix sp.]|nr:glycosyltransferase family 9 protein [Kouleothrix sp.]